MKSRLCLVLLLFSGACVLAAEPTAVPLSQEPHHRLVFQNDHTRVWNVMVAENESTLMHRHDHDYVAVIMTPSHVQNAVEGRPVTTGRAGVGEVRFTTAPMTHRLTNMSNTRPFRNLIIEILKKNAAKAGEEKGERGLEVGHGGLSDTVIDNDQVRVQDVQIAIGGMLHKHTHKFPFLVVALTDLELHNKPQGKPATMVSQKSGEVKWIGAGSTHEMMNMGKQEARFIEVEFK